MNDRGGAQDRPSPPPSGLDRTVADESDPPVVSPKVRPWLCVIHGADRSRHFPIDERPTTLGRGREADAVVQDDRASKVHCSVRLGPGGAVEVVDHGSRNGTFVDGRRVQTAVLLPTSQLRIGQTVLHLHYKDEDQVRAEEEAFRAAVTDALTGIPNRRGFFQRAAETIAASSRHGFSLSAVFLDVDHFKGVNDTYGHAGGDFVLKEAAARIDRLRRTEDVFGRYGGEEFVLLLPYTELEQAAVLAERLRAAVAGEPLVFDRAEIRTTVSAGLAAFAPGDTLESLLDRADQALYRAKQNGRNRIETAG